MTIRPTHHTDTSGYNRWYNTSQFCSIVANKTTALFKTGILTISLAVPAVGYWMGYGFVATTLTGSASGIGGLWLNKLLKQPNAPHPSAGETLHLIIVTLNTLAENIPPNIPTFRSPATLHELLLKDPHTYTRDDYRYLIEHVLVSSRSLVNWHSITGVHRKPFDELIAALEEDSDVAILKALEDTLAKLIELRATRLKLPPQEELIHPALEQIVAQLLLARHVALSAPNSIEIASLRRAAERVINVPALLSKDAQNTLTQLLNNDRPVSLKELDMALKPLEQLLPKMHPLTTELELLSPPLGVENAPHTNNPLQELCTQFIDKNQPLSLQLIKTVDVCYDLHLEAAIAHLSPQARTPKKLADVLTCIAHEKGFQGPLPKTYRERVNNIIDFILNSQE